jgi:hypothetical protein
VAIPVSRFCAVVSLSSATHYTGAVHRGMTGAWALAGSVRDAVAPRAAEQAAHWVAWGHPKI